MFRPKLEECLKGIFELEKVIYGNIGEGSEQNAVYVSIDQIKSGPAGKMTFEKINWVKNIINRIKGN